MVNVIVLCIELLLDVVGLVLGIIVFFRSSDNRLQKAWGMLAITCLFFCYAIISNGYGFSARGDRMRYPA